MEGQGQISKERLAKVTGVPVARLRQIASDGYFPKAEGGNYKLSEALTGLLKFFREASEKLPVYDSIEACCGATGLQRSLLKRAKQKGCKAFKSNRVDLAILLPWLFASPDEIEGTNWDESYKEWRAKRERQKYQLEEGKLIKADDAVSAGAEMWGALLKIFGQKFPSELPSRLRGLDELAMRRLLSESFQQGLDECRRVMASRIDRARKQDENEALAT